MYISPQLELPLAHVETDGIGMGVLADGTPYLTARGLARLCGQAPSVVIALTTKWAQERHKPRGTKVAALLAAQNYRRESLYIAIEVDNKRVHAHPDPVCVAILEYYAFECRSKGQRIAQQSFRLLARQSLRQYIYGRVGYDPGEQTPDKWRCLHERLVLNQLPTGYFSVFHEIADILVSAIHSGLIMDAHTLPDVSVGLRWARYWTACDLEQAYGERRKSPHEFPASFPQSKSGAVDIWVYPLEALGEFRLWLKNEYLPERFPGYLSRKVARGALPGAHAARLLSALNTCN